MRGVRNCKNTSGLGWGWLKQFPKHIGKREKHNEKEYKSKGRGGRGGAESVVFYGVLIMKPARILSRYW